MMKYYVISKNTEVNNEVFKNNNTYGIEVVGKYASMCTFNLDPQHGGMGKKENIAAARKATIIERLPKKDEIIIFSRVDPDALAACVILEERITGKFDNEFPIDMAMRINLISTIDEFNHKTWKPQTLPSTENKWPNGISLTYSAIAAQCFDFKVPIEERLEAMRKYLYTGEVNSDYIEKVEKERNKFIEELNNGKIIFKEIYPGVALIESESRNSTTVGYSIAPVVISINPKFSFQGGTPIRKWTISEYAEYYIDIENLTKELNDIESGCGGNKTLVGSPMGIDSKIPTEKLIDLVIKNLY